MPVGAEIEEDTEPARISLQQWDALADLRAAIVDALGMVARTIIAVNTPKGERVPDFPDQPRPETAIERVLRRQRDQAMTELEALVTGRRPR